MSEDATVEGERRGESVSTRIVFDANARSCAACGEPIEAGTRHKVLTVRGSDGVEQRPFCGEECLEQERSATAATAD